MVMATSGPFEKTSSMDDEGHVTYSAKFKVVGTTADGPANAMAAPGLPMPGSIWSWGDDVDETAICTPTKSVKEIVSQPGDPAYAYEVQCHWTSRVCQLIESLDPLLQPQKISVESVSYTEEGNRDQYNQPIVYSSWEKIRGQANEWDAGRWRVTIEQNVPNLELGLLDVLKHGLNDEPLWGCPRRSIKFSPGGAQEDCRGLGLSFWRRRLVFDIWIKEDPNNLGEYIGGWDRNPIDEGHKALNGKWTRAQSSLSGRDEWELLPVGTDDEGNPVMPHWNEPKEFILFTDKHGNHCSTILNGRGEPWDKNAEDVAKYWIYAGSPLSPFFGTCQAAIDGAFGEAFYGPWETEEHALSDSLGTPFNPDNCPGNGKVPSIRIDYYHSRNLLLLGIPTDFGGLSGLPLP